MPSTETASYRPPSRRAGITRTVTILAAAGLMHGIAACQFGNPTLTGNSDTAAGQRLSGTDRQGAERDAQRFTQFTDIPIPANAEIDLDELLVLGTEDGWIGRLPLRVGYEMTDMYSFYEREMPKFGWDQVTFVRSAISTMTYARGGRIATITLYGRTTGGSKVDFTVAPAAGQSSQLGARPAAAPATPVTSSRGGPVLLAPSPSARPGSG